MEGSLISEPDGYQSDDELSVSSNGTTSNSGDTDSIEHDGFIETDRESHEGQVTRTAPDSGELASPERVGVSSGADMGGGTVPAAVCLNDSGQVTDQSPLDGCELIIPVVVGRDSTSAEELEMTTSKTVAARRDA